VGARKGLGIETSVFRKSRVALGLLMRLLTRHRPRV